MYLHSHGLKKDFQSKCWSKMLIKAYKNTLKNSFKILKHATDIKDDS